MSFSILVLINIILISISVYQYLEIERIKEFTKYKRIPDLIEYCEGSTVVTDRMMWGLDREYRDSIYNVMFE